MIKALRILALAGILVVLGTWVALGAHRGWTMTAVPTKHIEPVTEIAFVRWDKRIVPGVDFLVSGLLGSAALYAATFIPNLKSNLKSKL